MQFATELIEQAQLDFAAQVEQATRVVVDDLMKEYTDKFERVKRAHAESFEHVELVAISELMKGGAVLKIFSGAVPDACSDPDPGVCLASISLPEIPFKKDGDRLVITEPFIGWGTREAGRGKLARSFFFIDREGEVIAMGTCGAPEDGDADLRLQRPAIRTGQKIVVAEFNFVMRND